MKILLICPEHRDAASAFHRMKPLALMPVLGRTLIEHHLLELAAAGNKKVVVLASDRPEMIRRAVGNGAAWGLEIEVIPTRWELTPEDAVVLYGGRDRCVTRVIDAMPDGTPIWSSTAETFNLVTSFLDRQVIAGSLTMREVKPQIWVSTKAKVADGAIIDGPVWIGPHATVCKGAVIGPRSVVEAHAWVDEMATLKESWVGPSTYVGAAADVNRALVWGQTITHWEDGSQLETHDSLVLADLSARRTHRISWMERAAALLLMLSTLPAALLVMLRSKLRGEGISTSRTVLSTDGTLILHSLTGTTGLLQRWPELRSVVRGELALVGNRPLTPQDTTELRGEMGQLWFSVPAGVFSLADAEGEDASSVSSSLTHAAYYAARRSLHLRISILLRCLRKPFSNTIQTQPLPCS